MVSLVVSGCNSTPTKASAPEVSITIKDQDRIYFSGKGAGAGMMMSPAMGTMGIAIGVAIDEGIAKDIQKAFESAGGNVSRMLETELSQWLCDHCNDRTGSIESICASESIAVNTYRYGFGTSSGE